MENILQFALKGKERAKSFLAKRVMLLLFAGAFAICANAGTYNYLEFTNISGTKTVFNVANLTIKVSGNDLQVTNNNGTVNLTLVELASMQFTSTNTVTALENVLNADAEVQVSTIAGASIGTYSSLIEVTQSLNAGVYVISNGTQSQTIVIK